MRSNTKRPRNLSGVNKKLFFTGGYFLHFCTLFNTASTAGSSFYFSVNAGIEIRTVATLTLAVRRCITTGLDLNKSSEAIQYLYKCFLFQHGHELVRAHCALRNCGEGCDEPEPGTGPPRHSRGGGPASAGRLLGHFGRHLGRLHAGRGVQSPCQHRLAQHLFAPITSEEAATASSGRR